MTTIHRWVLLLVTVVTLQACSSTPLTPSQTAQQFWSAMLAGDVNSANQFATDSSKPLLNEKQKTYKNSAVAFGKIAMQSEQANIETTIQPADKETADKTSGPASSAAFETILKKQKQQWRVDFIETQKSYEQATQAKGVKRLVNDLNNLGHKFTHQLNDALQRWDEAKPQIKKDLENLGDSVQHDLQGAIDKYGPELQHNLQEFTESIDKALKDLNKQLPPKDQEEQTPPPKGRLI